MGFVALFFAVYLGLLAGRETPPFEISRVYSLSLGEDERVDVRYVTATDLTGDGRKEVLMSYDGYSYEEQVIEGALTFAIRYKEARMLVFSSNGVGNFRKLREYSSGLTRQTIAVGDFNGDGKLDIVVGGSRAENEEDPESITSRVEVLLQKENGGFDNVFSTDIPQFLLTGLAVGEFVQNGRSSFVVGGRALESESPYHAYLFHNEGEGNFTMSPIALREKIGVEDMWKADINSDGSPDLIIQAFDFDDETYSLILLLNDGRGEFEFGELDISVDSMVIEDFARNGYPDILYTQVTQTGSEVYFLRNNQGEFAEPQLVDVTSEGRFVGMISADFKNDNNQDVLLFRRYLEFREGLGKFETNIIGHLLVIDESTEGELSFAPEWSHKFVEGKDISSKHAAVAADINDDGWIDLIVVSGEGDVYLALNKHT